MKEGSELREQREARQRLTDLYAESDGLLERMKGITSRAQAEHRDLRPDEVKQHDKLESQLEPVSKEIRELRDSVLFGERGAMLNGGRANRSGFVEVGSRDGADVRTPLLNREQRMTDWAATHSKGGEFTVDDAADFSIGNIMRAMVEPDFRSELTEVERRVLAEGTDSAGGFWTPEPLSASIIDKVRATGKVFAAGATTVPLDSDKQSIPRLTGDPSGSWRAENGAFTESDATFDRVNFAPKAYGFIVKTSEELYQDMVPGGSAKIEDAIVQTAALELDRVALRGSGTSNQPTGILNQAGVTKALVTGANGGTPTRYTEVMTGITALLTANREPDAWLMAPRTSQFYDGLADTTNQPLNQPRPVAALSRFVTSQIPTNITKGTSNDCSEVYIGQFADLLVGIRLGIQLRLLTERYADNGQYAWRVFLRADVQLAHPESFYVLEGVRP